ncbi:unnamed protein product [Ilex paraguariensis]|uniref:DUF4378 domain-containing protein n=1 Tax=Ilex paraguariensis TaxID=185542 RepID=A0ABC8TF78_9AQUA
MSQKHLHELLKEDQQPFQLKDYIADRRWQLKRPTPKTTLQVKKRKPIVESSKTKRRLYKQACFFPFHDSPDGRKSPSLNFPAPEPKSPCKSPNGSVFLHIPTRTAALLLEAAMRIQKQSSCTKTKTQIRNVKSGLFGSILKRLKDRNQTKRNEIGNAEIRVSSNELPVGREKISRKSENMQENAVAVDDKTAYEMGFSCSCNNSRLSSAGWSESNEEKSLDLETSSSCRSEDMEEIEFVAEERENGGFTSCENQFCSSPFRFSIQKSPSSGRRTPDFLTPATSPSRHKKEEKENYEVENLQKIQLEEEEKEQCSPVCVLEPPFDDEDDEHEGGDQEEEGYDLECSYAIVQRAKQQLLHKLRRFEKLAELDPIELEKIMLDDQDDEDDNELQEEEDECEDNELLSENNVDELVREVFSILSLHHLITIPAHMKRLVADLIDEERREMDGLDGNEAVAKRVCKRLDSWKDVNSNTIDMMVDSDFRRKVDGWNRYQEQIGEPAMEIELAIFGLLVEELSGELICLASL